jgi:hypothetical protein
VSGRGQRHEFVLNPARVTRVLTCAAVLIVSVGVGTQCVKYLLGFDHLLGLVGLFDLDYERNIPALFSVCLLGAAFLLLATITVLEKRRSAKDLLAWRILTLGFFVMSVDESWSFHEKLNLPVRAMLGHGDGGLLHYAWVLPGLMLVVGLGVAFWQFLARLAPATRVAFILSGGIYLTGAIGMEAVGGVHGALYGETNLPHALLAAAEESLEMAGSILFIRALLVYLAVHFDEVVFRMQPQASSISAPR